MEFLLKKSNLIIATIAGMIIAACLILGSLFSVAELNSYIRTMYGDNVRPIEYLAHIRTAETSIRGLVWKAIVLHDPANTTASISEIKVQLSQIDEKWALYYPAGVNGPEETAIAEALKADLSQFRGILQEAITGLGRGDYDGVSRRFQAQIPVLDRMDRWVTEDITLNVAQAAAFTKKGESLFDTVIWIGLISLALGLIVATVTIVNLLRQRDIAIHQSEEHLWLVDKVFNMTSNSVFITDDKGKITKVNPAFSKLTGYAEQEVVGHSPDMWNSGRQTAGFYYKMWSRLQASGYWEGMLWNCKKNGDIYLASQAITAIHDGKGQCTHYMAVYSDITQRQQEEERRNYLATHDVLTNLPNRLLFQERLMQAITKAYRVSTQVAVMFLDLDHFKVINDTLGHEAGDTTLITVAMRLKQALRESDTVARLGGDEFAFILEDVRNAEDVLPIAHKLLQSIAEPIQVGSHAVLVTPSIGISLYPDDGYDPEQLLKRADLAMYGAKNAGKNAVRFFAGPSDGSMRDSDDVGRSRTA